MYTRVVTYDLKYANAHNYQDLYDYLYSTKSQKLTESCYLIKSSLPWDDFKDKIKSITKNGDNVKAIVINRDKELDIFTIR